MPRNNEQSVCSKVTKLLLFTGFSFFAARTQAAPIRIQKPSGSLTLVSCNNEATLRVDRPISFTLGDQVCVTGNGHLLNVCDGSMTKINDVTPTQFKPKTPHVLQDTTVHLRRGQTVEFTNCDEVISMTIINKVVFQIPADTHSSYISVTANGEVRHLQTGETLFKMEEGKHFTVKRANEQKFDAYGQLETPGTAPRM